MAEITVRSLDGSATSVRISPDSTIADLKTLLKHSLSFPPAVSAPSFHLFLKGEKLSYDREIRGISMENGEFIVLVPFAKKVRRSEISPDAMRPSVESSSSFGSQAGMESSCTKAAWLDMMRDLSSISDPSGGNPSESRMVSGALAESSSGVDGKSRKEHFVDQVLSDILRSECGGVTDKGVTEKIYHFIRTVSCLSDRGTKKCMVFKEFSRKNKNEMERCMCPLWMRRLIKCFAFINICYGVCQIQCESLTWDKLKEVMSSTNVVTGTENFGVSDVELLLVLFPKVVKLAKDGRKLPTYKGSVVIFDAISEPQRSKPSLNGKQRLSSLSIINSLEKRECAFRSDLWKALKCLLHKKDISLDDLKAVKESRMLCSKGNVMGTRSSSYKSQCHSKVIFKPKEMVEHLRAGLGNRGQIVHVEEIDARLAILAELPSGLSETTKTAIKGIGISLLYKHQVEAIQASLMGKSVVVATSTSSGKSLCYNLPVIDEMTKNSTSCALYLFPTKALAQDQLKSLSELTRGSGINLCIGVYDGDTSKERRSWLRDNARVLITNPDMLHISILPFHVQFQRVLSNLSYVVIDEAHIYNGAFGCHTALILRRLRRICSHVYGSDPSFIFCSATSGNPCEHAMELANLQDMELIQKDCSPCGSKTFLLWNPRTRSTDELVSNAHALKHNFRQFSPIRETSCLFAEMVQHGLRCIAFCRTRKLCELVLCYTVLLIEFFAAEILEECSSQLKNLNSAHCFLKDKREILEEVAPDLVDLVSCYRAGYTVEERRRIEAALFSGKLRGVAATNALELGIDVGCLDATLHLGFPGSIASLWQQAGRSGRRENQSLAIYIAFEGPLDQYFMKLPHKLFGGQIECAQVDPHNQQLLEQHLICAAFEHPLSLIHDEMYFSCKMNSAITALINKGYLCGDPSSCSSTKLLKYIGPERVPSHAVSIRSIETNKYKVVDIQNNDIIEEIEESRAFFQLLEAIHNGLMPSRIDPFSMKRIDPFSGATWTPKVYEGAVYLNQGITYLVKSLDLHGRIALCQKADLKYYTKTRDYTDIHVIGGDLAYPPTYTSETKYSRTTAHITKCEVTTCWFGFYRIWCRSNQIFDRVDLSLPKYSYESQAVWIRIPRTIKVTVEIQELSFRAGQHAASHALLNAVPLFLMCNSSDLAAECANPHDNRDIPERILLYDQCPGGIGISTQLHRLFDELLDASLCLVTACNCSNNTGCPSCIQTLTCQEFNEVLDKKAALMILQGVKDSEDKLFGDR